MRALHHAETQCDRAFGHQPENSPMGVLFLVLVHWSRHGPIDMFTGVPFDVGGSPHSPRGFTMVAHQVHHAPFNFGFDRPYPTDLSQYNSGRVNARLELWICGIASLARSHCPLPARF